jgi:hypothetical protein
MDKCDILVEEFKLCIRKIQDISTDCNYQLTRCNFIWKELVTCFNDIKKTQTHNIENVSDKSNK